MEGNFEHWEEGWSKYVCGEERGCDCDWFSKRNNSAKNFRAEFQVLFECPLYLCTHVTDAQTFTSLMNLLLETDRMTWDFSGKDSSPTKKC